MIPGACLNDLVAKITRREAERENRDGPAKPRNDAARDRRYAIGHDLRGAAGL